MVTVSTIKFVLYSISLGLSFFALGYSVSSLLDYYIFVRGKKQLKKNTENAENNRNRNGNDRNSNRNP